MNKKQVDFMSTAHAKNKRVFIVKYLKATNTKGTRFKITDTMHKGKSFIYNWNDELPLYRSMFLWHQALEVFEKCKINIEYTNTKKEGVIEEFFSCDFTTMLTKEVKK